MLSRQPRLVRLAAAPVLAALTTISIMGVGALGGFASLVTQLFLIPMLVLTLYYGFVPMVTAITMTGIVIGTVWNWSIGFVLVMILGISCLITWGSTWRPADTGPNQHIFRRLSQSWVPNINSGLMIPICALAMAACVGIVGSVEIITHQPVGTVVFDLAQSIIMRSQNQDMSKILDAPDVRFGLMGFIASIFMVAVVFNAMIADWMGAFFLRTPRRNAGLMTHIYLPAWYPFAIIALVILALLPMNKSGDLFVQIRVLATNMMIVLLLPALFMGLSVIHAWLAHIGRGRIVALLFFYAAWSVFFIPIGIMIVTLGILANPLRIGRPSSAQSSESITG